MSRRLLGSAATGSCTRILAKYNLGQGKNKELFAIVQKAHGRPHRLKKSAWILNVQRGEANRREQFGPAAGALKECTWEVP
jgi:hypothetical protein